MNKKVLIVEDQFVEAHDLQLMLEKAGYEVCGIARSVPVAQEMINKERPGLVLLDIFLKGKQTGIDLARGLRENNIAFIYLSANSNEEVLNEAKTTEPYGFIVKPFRERDLLVTLEIAQYRHEHSRQSSYMREVELVQQLEKTITQKIDWNARLLQISRLMQQEIPFDYFAIEFTDFLASSLRIGFNEYQLIGINQLVTISGTSRNQVMEMLDDSGKKIAAFFNDQEFIDITDQASLKKLVRDEFSLRSLLSFPLAVNETVCVLCFYSRRPDAYNADQIALLHRLQPTLIAIIEQITAAEKSAGVARHEKKEIASLKNTNVAPPHFEGIVGNSHLLLNVFDQVTQVAPFDTSVLILGESGTGKERIADSIHRLSPRKQKPFVKVNCAALPANLIESELFGHEKGSFTGAIDKRIGKFEQANGGTIFLDETGEMPVDLQVKLLRVLQEKEIEPIGCRSSVKIDVRVIAATNRNLEKEVAEGRFRLDLYYRLNVFPIVVPSLRDRVEDIPLLIDHFIDVYNRKAGKRITGVSDKVLKNWMTYAWPGNIRELEHLIERSVLLAKGTIIQDTLVPANLQKDIASHGQALKTIHENERDYIISVLKKCRGKIWGSGGAAEILNVPPSTLKSKMKKLGIPKEDAE